jgi:hypothetical protein
VDKEKIISKIRKLLAMAGSKSYNEHEATNAASQAQKLLTKHNLSISEVEAKEVETLDMKFTDDGDHVYDWKIYLSQGIETAFGVRIFILGNVESGRQFGVRFIGGAVDISVAKYTYEYLIETVDRLYKEKQEQEQEEPLAEFGEWSAGPMTAGIFQAIRTSARKNTHEHSFKKGIVESLNTKLRAMVAKAPQQEETGIIHIKGHALRQYVDNLDNVNEEPIKQKQPDIDFESYLYGTHVGHGVEIRKGIQ